MGTILISLLMFMFINEFVKVSLLGMN